MNKLWRQKKLGSSVVLVLFAVVLLSIMGIGLLSLGMHSRVFAIRVGHDISARVAADAGLIKALFEMNEKLKIKPWDDSTLPFSENETMPNCSEIFSYEVYNVKPGTEEYSIESYGRSLNSERNVKIDTLLELQSRFNYALFTEKNLLLHSGSIVNAYNLEEGETFEMGTNSTDGSTIRLQKDIAINGDIVVGVNGDPNEVIKMGPGVAVTGDTYPLVESYKWVEVKVPEAVLALASQGKIVEGATLSGNIKADEIDIGNKGIITINGPTTLYVIGDIQLDYNSQLIIDPATNPDASLKLYLGGDIVSQNSAELNNMTQDPKNFEINGLETCENIDIKAKGDFYGSIYAPNAKVVSYNSMDFYGAIACYSFEQKNSGEFNYDGSLADADINDEGVRFVFKQWHED